jgi:hypothetical protein
MARVLLFLLCVARGERTVYDVRPGAGDHQLRGLCPPFPPVEVRRNGDLWELWAGQGEPELVATLSNTPRRPFPPGHKPSDSGAYFGHVWICAFYVHQPQPSLLRCRRQQMKGGPSPDEGREMPREGRQLSGIGGFSAPWAGGRPILPDGDTAREARSQVDTGRDPADTRVEKTRAGVATGQQGARYLGMQPGAGGAVLCRALHCTVLQKGLVLAGRSGEGVALCSRPWAATAGRWAGGGYRKKDCTLTVPCRWSRKVYVGWSCLYPSFELLPLLNRRRR